MLKRPAELLNDAQITALKGRMWWVADRNKPFLMKFALQSQFIILQLTDLKSLWIGRYHMKTLIEDKSKYAKTLEIKQNKDLLILFDSLLSNSDPQASYAFKQQQAQMSFVFKKRIQIYDFNWTFKLEKVVCNTAEIVCRQLVQPLYTILQTYIKRMEVMRKRFEQVEKDYIKKMSEMEKNIYRSPLIEDLNEIPLTLPPPSQYLIDYIPLDNNSLIIFKAYIDQIINKPKEELVKVQAGGPYPKPKAMKKNEDMELDGQFLLHEEIEKDLNNTRIKKKQIIDFI